MVHLLASVVIFIAIFSVAFGQGNYSGTALDTYVNTPDSAYQYHLMSTSTDSPLYTLYTLNMTSQRWQTPQFSDHYYWHHVVWVCVPNKVNFKSRGFMFINAGTDNSTTANGDGLEAVFLDFCATSGAISSLLYQVPNQPITFYNPPAAGLEEDAIIAYTFRYFLNESGSDPTKILQFPMTKACVRGLDTIQNFTQTLGYNLTSFTVSGASKRGWATWLTAAVDPRVVALMPIVIPLLNTKANILNEWPSLGEWGWALDDYTAQHVFDYAGTPQFDLLMTQVDPLAYNSRYLNKPKLVIDGTLDQFFLLDGPKYFWDQLTGPKWLALVPNADHSFGDTPYAGQVLFSLLVSFFALTANNVPLPTLTWEKVYSNVTSVPPQIKLSSNFAYPFVQLQGAYVWAVNTTRPGYRDFRLNPCPDTSVCFSYLYDANHTQFTSTFIPFTGAGSATYDVIMNDLPPITSSVHDQRWLGFFVQALYNISGFPLLITSEANVFPDFYPFPPHVSDYAAIGFCNLTVEFDQTNAGGWTDGSGNTYSQWSVTLENTDDLYSAQIEVDGPITSIWGLNHKSGNIYTIPDYQYQNGVIPAGSDYVQFGYITKSAHQAVISLVNNASINACAPSSSSSCSVQVTSTVTSQWSSGKAVFQSVAINVKNTGKDTAANTQIEFNLLHGSTLTQTWNLALVSSVNSTLIYTCSLYNLPAGQTSSSCGYVIDSPTGALPAVALSSPQTICL